MGLFTPRQPRKRLYRPRKPKSIDEPLSSEAKKRFLTLLKTKPELESLLIQKSLGIDVEAGDQANIARKKIEALVLGRLSTASRQIRISPRG